MQATLGFYCNNIIQIQVKYDHINRIERRYFYEASVGNEKKKLNMRDRINDISLYISAASYRTWQSRIKD